MELVTGTEMTELKRADIDAGGEGDVPGSVDAGELGATLELYYKDVLIDQPVNYGEE